VFLFPDRESIEGRSREKYDLQACWLPSLSKGTGRTEVSINLSAIPAKFLTTFFLNLYLTTSLNIELFMYEILRILMNFEFLMTENEMTCECKTLTSSADELRLATTSSIRNFHSLVVLEPNVPFISPVVFTPFWAVR
jgi:hypothetical protein